MAAGRRLDSGRLNITVKDGVDVNYQLYGDRKGSYFMGVPGGDATVHINNVQRKTWTIVLENVKTRAQSRFQFSHEMYVGRMPANNPSMVKLVLENDGAVSGIHCRIFEMGDRLVIEDLGSRNHTFLNGMMIQQPTEIPAWGMIKVGSSEFRVLQMGVQ